MKLTCGWVWPFARLKTTSARELSATTHIFRARFWKLRVGAIVGAAVVGEAVGAERVGRAVVGVAVLGVAVVGAKEGAAEGDAVLLPSSSLRRRRWSGAVDEDAPVVGASVEGAAIGAGVAQSQLSVSTSMFILNAFVVRTSPGMKVSLSRAVARRLNEKTPSLVPLEISSLAREVGEIGRLVGGVPAQRTPHVF